MFFLVQTLQLKLLLVCTNLHCLPAPLPVLGVLREPPKVEIRFYHLWSQDVVLLARADCLSLHSIGEAKDLRPQLGRGPVVGFMTRVGDAFCDLNMPSALRALQGVCSQS